MPGPANFSQWVAAWRPLSLANVREDDGTDQPRLAHSMASASDRHCRRQGLRLSAGQSIQDCTFVQELWKSPSGIHRSGIQLLHGPWVTECGVEPQQACGPRTARGGDMKTQANSDCQDCSVAAQTPGDLLGIHSGFPCGSFSRLGFIRRQGLPAPVRSASHIYGLLSNNARQQAEADRGTLMAANSTAIDTAQKEAADSLRVPPVNCHLFRCFPS
eukprot:2843435-Amphidinium_carterae.1